jgi:hypothetical protein
MTFKLLAELARLSIVDVDERIVATCNDLVFVKLETRNNVTRMSCERDVARFNLAAGPTLTDHVMTAVK